jgi:hypothetical protein
MRKNCKIPLLCVILCFVNVSIISLLSADSTNLPMQAASSSKFHCMNDSNIYSTLIVRADGGVWNRCLGLTAAGIDRDRD